MVGKFLRDVEKLNQDREFPDLWPDETISNLLGVVLKN